MADPTISSSMLEEVPVGGVRMAETPAWGGSVEPPPDMRSAMDAVTIKVGDLFADMKQFRAKLGLYGITHKCPYRARRSDNSRFVGICPIVMNELKKDPKQGENSNADLTDALDERLDSKATCPFNIIARRRKEGGVCVTRAVLQHAPDCQAPVSFSTSATSAYMSQLMEENASSIAPREIGKFVHEATGTKLSYSTLWRTSHMLQSKERERQDATFKKIVPFLNAFREANPGTLAVVEQRPDGRFYRFFLCPGALASAFGDCPFSMHVEAMPITSFHGGSLMVAFVKDGLHSLLPTAMAITPMEDEDNWCFFFHQLLTVLPIIGCPGMTLSHAKDDALYQAQLAVLPASRCVTSFVRYDWTASGTLHEYYVHMSQLCASSYFMIIVGWITQAAVLMYARYMELETERSIFPGEILGRGNVSTSGWEIASFGPSDYIVINAHERQQVNLALRSCSCGQWIDHPFPCIHATRCLPLERLVSLAQFVHPSYFTESLRRCYSRRMALIDASAIAPQPSSTLDRSNAFVSEHGTSLATGPDGVMIPAEMPLLPPTFVENVKRGRGRPRVARPSTSQRGGSLGAMYQCGHCHGKGHNSRTCPLNSKSEITTSASASVTLDASAAPEPTVFADAPVSFALDASLATPTGTV
mgnify:FL=1